MVLDLISCHCAKGKIPWSILALYMKSLRNRDAIEDKETWSIHCTRFTSRYVHLDYPNKMRTPEL